MSAKTKSKVNLDLLQADLSAMQPRDKLYQIVKAEMVKRGRWKQLPRGNHNHFSRDNQA